jgi:hypothetical protein
MTNTTKKTSKKNKCVNIKKFLFDPVNNDSFMIHLSYVDQFLA